MDSWAIKWVYQTMSFIPLLHLLYYIRLYFIVFYYFSCVVYFVTSHVSVGCGLSYRWAIESRVYAENPLRNFLPSIGEYA